MPIKKAGMQNIDYSRRFRQSPVLQPRVKTEHFHQSGFIVLIGSIFIFTAGIFVGLRLEQKEKSFAKNENMTVRNYGEDSAPKKADVPVEAKKQTDTIGGLKFPPQKNAQNFLLEIKSGADVTNMGKELLLKNADLQGRIFKTSSGKLYVGYFYQKKDAEKIQEKLNQQFPGLATLKTVK